MLVAPPLRLKLFATESISASRSATEGDDKSRSAIRTTFSTLGRLSSVRLISATCWSMLG